MPILVTSRPAPAQRIAALLITAADEPATARAGLVA